MRTDRLLLPATLLLLLLLPSCATIVSDKSYPVTIWTDPPGAEVEVQDEYGALVHRGVSPFTLQLKTDDGWFTGMDYVAHASLLGYEPQTFEVSSNFNEWYIGNLVFGGALGLLIVDPLTGAMWEFDGRYGQELALVSTGEGVAPTDAVAVLE